jgi:hypothetical protein
MKDVHAAFRAVDYMDRFSSCLHNAHISDVWQSCVMAACLLIASKVETIERSIHPEDLVFLSEIDGPSKKDIIEMEITILNTLKFEMETATSIQFLYLYMDKMKLDVAERMFASRMCEKSLGRSEFYQFYPSQVALGCIDLALEHTKNPSRNEQMTAYRESIQGGGITSVP